MGAASGMRTSQVWATLFVAVLFVALTGAPSALGQPPAKKRGIKVATLTPAPDARLGSYYALIIGIKNYQNYARLETPINDANEVAAILREQYGFRTQVLLDATRDQILDALGRYRTEIHEEDNLLIYYAGHGNFDKPSDLAYWYPVEAGKASTARWINATEITGQARAIPARHVLVIADSCYSGMIARGASPTIDVPQERNAYLKKLMQRKSRHVMASGGDEPVADTDTSGHPTGHSVFANALLQGLKEFHEAEYSAEELFNQYVREQVAGRSRQLPEYDAIRDSDHDGGGFVFLRTHGLPAPPLDEIRDKVKPVNKIDLIETHPAPPRRRDDPETEAIRMALRRYEKAYATMDIKKLKAVWPSMTKEQSGKLKSGFVSEARAVEVHVRKCDPATPSGDTIEMKCEQAMAYTLDGTQQPETTNPVEISLRKDAGGQWVVADVRAR